MTGHHGAFYRAVVEPDSPLGHTCSDVAFENRIHSVGVGGCYQGL